ncbi:hypothetical protein CMUS01_15423 [Colletotrichum musicola]|uniref:Uncharacterized protein n=1 Tax=Colletotrichum musicola TaxID=2175873 RepID=A0A8H6IWM2_9PEZI|nr:hypothetical protein CMUS01_15423 [Colletotrichum musicola]
MSSSLSQFGIRRRHLTVLRSAAAAAHSSSVAQSSGFKGHDADDSSQGPFYHLRSNMNQRNVDTGTSPTRHLHSPSTDPTPPAEHSRNPTEHQLRGTMLARSAEDDTPFVALPPHGGNWQPSIDASQNSMIASKQVEPVQNRMATIGQQLGAGASTGDLVQQTAHKLAMQARL